MYMYMLLLLTIILGCAASTTSNQELIDANGETIATRINAPEGFQRTSGNGFADYLRGLQLKPDGTAVYFFDGTKKGSADHSAVIDLDVGTRDLQQCADAVMRLRAEYLFTTSPEDIHFNFTNGMRVDYTKWRAGYRMQVNGNQTKWVKKTAPDHSYKGFRKYMDLIFTYAGTLSLEKELKAIKIEDIRPGDVFIQGGSPGHAMMVMDVVEKEGGSEKLFLLSQSYMPAQSIHIVNNPKDSKLSPWYSTKDLNVLYTPDWRFEVTDLKRF